MVRALRLQTGRTLFPVPEFWRQPGAVCRAHITVHVECEQEWRETFWSQTIKVLVVIAKRPRSRPGLWALNRNRYKAQQNGGVQGACTFISFMRNEGQGFSEERGMSEGDGTVTAAQMIKDQGNASFKHLVISDREKPPRPGSRRS